MQEPNLAPFAANVPAVGGAPPPTTEVRNIVLLDRKKPRSDRTMFALPIATKARLINGYCYSRFHERVEVFAANFDWMTGMAKLSLT